MSDPQQPQDPTGPTGPTGPAEPSAPAAGGGRRRAAAAPTSTGRRRPDAVLLAAVLLPVLAVVAGLAVRVGAPPPRASAPDLEPRAEATLLCPSAGVPAGSTPEGTDPDDVLPDGGTVRAATGADLESADDAVIEVGVGTPGSDDVETSEQEAASGAVVDVATGDRALVRASGAGAAGLVASRFDASGGAGVACRAPSTGAWFVGLGAGADRSAVVELSNPDSGTAVATLTLYDGSGEVSAESIRSVVLESGTARRLDLGALAPTRGELALHVDVSRGRLGVEALQTTQPLDGGTGASYWAAGVAEPQESTTLLGLPGDASAARTLLLTNPSDTTAQVQVQLLGAEGAFAPTDLEESVVPPGTVASVDLTSVLGAALADGGQGASGIRVLSSVPVVAGLRSGSGAEETTSAVATAAPADTGTGAFGAVLPTSPSAAGLVLANAGEEAATAVVVARDAAGAEVAREEVRLAGGASGRVGVPTSAARVEVEADPDADVRGALVVTAGRTSVLGLTPVVPDELVPTVRRAWP